MDAISPTNVASVYAFRAYQQAQRVAPASPSAPSLDVAMGNPNRARIAGTLVAAVVPGKVDFVVDDQGRSAAVVAEAIPMYRHPADRNAAATGVNAGRSLDVEG